MTTRPHICSKDVPATARAAAEALIVYHLNPLLKGRQALIERLEELRDQGQAEGVKSEEMALLCLESAYRDGLKLLRWVLAPCKELLQ